MTLPGNVGHGTVTGVFMDTSGTLADGTVTFTPSPSKFLDASATPPATIIPTPVTATVTGGTFSISLLATNDTDLNPSGWTYMVSFKLKIGGAAITIAPFPINVPEGTTVDLTTVAPVGASNGATIIRGFGIPDPASGTPGQAAVISPDGTAVVWDDIVSSVASTDITDATTVGEALIVAASAAAGRTALGLGSASTQATSAFDAAGAATAAQAAAIAASDSAGAAAAAQAAAIAASQPVDSDLTAIAALTTTSYGRALLALANQAALLALLPAATTGGAGVAPLATGTEATTGTDTGKAVTSAALKTALDARIAALVNSAPGTMDTLGEIATLLAADESTAAALATTVAGKAAKASNLSDLASTATALTNLGGVPTSRTVNAKALSANVVLALADLVAGADYSMATHKITDVVDPTGSQDVATKNYVDTTSTGITSLTYANAAPGTRFTMLWDGSTGFKDPVTGSTAASRPSARTDIFFDLIGGSVSVTDPAYMIAGDARELTS